MDLIVDKDGNELIIEVFHPGEFLLEEIESRGMLKKDVAKELDNLPHHLSEIFAGKRNISAKGQKIKQGISSHLYLMLQKKWMQFFIQFSAAYYPVIGTDSSHP